MDEYEAPLSAHSDQPSRRGDANEPIPVPFLSSEQAKELDRLMVELYHIDPLQSMENAGRSLALLAKTMLDGDLQDRSVVVLAGRGANGGGGLSAARHLINWGAWVQVICAAEAGLYKGAAAHQLAALNAMGASLAWAEEGWELPPADLVIDAIIGYGLHGHPKGKPRDLIHLANSSAAPILSLETPSGVDTDSGACYAPHIRAAATLTLALPTGGLLVAPGRSACGRLLVADIGVPAALWAQMGLDVQPIFGLAPILDLTVQDGQAWATAFHTS